LKKGVVVLRSTGMVRRIDELGRVVIPIELRRNMGIDERDPLEILVDGEQIVLRKFEPACVFCGNVTNVQSFNRKIVCCECVTAMFENASAM
jgi:transcriptional pleiotropic regulator of transition state genes